MPSVHGSRASRDVADLAREALARRNPILRDGRTNILRIVNGALDGLPGLVVERYGEVLIAQLHEGRLTLSEADAQRACAAVLEACGARCVYRKWFPRDRSGGRSPGSDATDEAANREPTPWLGQAADEEYDALENGVRFRIRPHDGFSVGLFPDQRGNRERVRKLAGGRRVLNTFAYTCGFSVAAALGGATATVNVDVSRRFLEWGKRNFAANQLSLDAHRFFADDTFDAYKRLARRGERFDLIILDPPTFARTRDGRPFSVARDMQALIEGALPLASRGCALLISTNHRGTDRRRLETALESAAGACGRDVRVTERPRLPLDFRGDAEHATAIFATVS
ncbi:MAG: class I SAM-dependent methyltransferase [Phycisphaerae bacterium]